MNTTRQNFSLHRKVVRTFSSRFSRSESRNLHSSQREREKLETSKSAFSKYFWGLHILFSLKREDLLKWENVTQECTQKKFE